MSVPSTANANTDENGHHCNDNTKRDQKLNLSWEKIISNDTSLRPRNIVTITFTQSVEKRNYGISRITGEFELKDKELYNEESIKPEIFQNRNVLTLDSEPWYHLAKNDETMFISPNNRSFSS